MSNAQQLTRTASDIRFTDHFQNKSTYGPNTFSIGANSISVSGYVDASISGYGTYNSSISGYNPSPIASTVSANDGTCVYQSQPALNTAGRCYPGFEIDIFSCPTY